MARTARMYLETSFFHVMVQGINKEYIFNKERYIKRYLKIIDKYKDEFDMKLYAYCVMNNHSHFLINTENINYLSKFMQKVNSEYAKYYNYMEERVGYVFRDRYKSEPILDKRQLIQCIKYIHRNPVKANMVTKEEDYQYSSYRYYTEMMKHNNQNYDIFNDKELEYICGQNHNDNMEFMDVDVDIDNKINYLISEFIREENIKIFEIFENNDILKKLIKYLKQENKIKYTDIIKNLDISKGTMDRLKK